MLQIVKRRDQRANHRSTWREVLEVQATDATMHVVLVTRILVAGMRDCMCHSAKACGEAVVAVVGERLFAVMLEAANKRQVEEAVVWIHQLSKVLLVEVAAGESNRGTHSLAGRSETAKQ